MSNEEKSPFGGFFVGVGALGGAVFGAGVSAENGSGNLWAGLLGGLFFGAIVGSVVEYVLGVLWKILLVVLTIIIMVLRFQACAAIREGMSSQYLTVPKTVTALCFSRHTPGSEPGFQPEIPEQWLSRVHHEPYTMEAADFTAGVSRTCG